MLRLKTWIARRASNHSAFMSKWSTVINLIHPKDSYPSRKRGFGVSPRFHLVVFLWLVWIKRNRRQGEPKITNTNGGKLLHRPSFRYKKILDRVVFAFELCILLGEYDTKLYIMLLLLEWEEEIFFFVNV